LLQTHDHIGKPRIESIVRRLRELNPRCDIVGVPENVSDGECGRLGGAGGHRGGCRAAVSGAAGAECGSLASTQADGRVRHAHAGGERDDLCAWQDRLPRLLCARSAADWTRQFPVFGAVSGTAACVGAMEVIKLITGLGTTLQGELLSMNLATMQFRKVRLPRRDDCAVCG
jgi:molybdopterin/thiamine biosynthesis adenylyltransferase